VILPAWSEQNSIGLVIDALPQFYVERVVVADTNSTDKPAGVAHDQGQDFLVDKINSCKHRQHNIINTLLRELAHVPVEAFTSTLHRLVAQLTQMEYAYVINKAGRQISDTVFGSTAGVCAASHMFKPVVVGTEHSLLEFSSLRAVIAHSTDVQ